MPQYSDEKLIEWLKQEVPKSRSVVHKWRKEIARPAYQFVAGGKGQWEEEDINILEEADRTQVTFNRIGPMVQAINGVEVNNRLEVDFVPPEPDDKPIVEVAKMAGKWALSRTDAEDHDSHMFRDTTICGMGWTEHYMAYEEDPDGKYEMRRRSPFNYLWDVRAVEQNLADARWVAYIMELDDERAEYMFGEGVELFGEFLGEQPEDISQVGATKEYPKDYEGTDNVTDTQKRRGKIVADVQYWRVVPAYRMILPDGSLDEVIQQDMFDEIRAGFSNAGMEIQEGLNFVRIPHKVYYRAFISGTSVLEHGVSPCDSEFTHLCATGIYDEIKGWWYGVVEDLKDPQRWINKIYSESVDAYRSSIKGGILREQGVVVNEEEWKENIAKPNADLVVVDGAISQGRVQLMQPTQLSSHLPQLLSVAMQMPQMVSGLNMEFMGLADREQAGVLERERKMASMTILAPLFGSFRHYRKAHARLLFKYLQKYFTPERLARVVGNRLAQAIQAFKAADVLRYDVMVDESPFSTSVKQYVFQLMNEMLQRNPELQAMLLPEWIEYSPMPAAISMKIKEAIEARQQPDPKQEMLMMAEMGKLASEIKLNLAKAEQAFAKAETEGDKSANEEARIMMDSMRQSLELVHRAQEMNQKMAIEKYKVDNKPAPKGEAA